MNIPFLNLKSQYLSIKPEIDMAVKRVIDSQFFVLGEELENFESEFSAYLGSKYTVGVGSGTDGLILALMALGIGKGDEVITQPNSFIATTIAITQVGATPIFVDCDPETYQMDITKVEEKITKRTKAIIPVHLYGAPMEIEELQDIAKKNNLFLIEDACQAHGTTINNRKTGTYGDMGVFSFYPGKNMGGYGDGGCVVTNDIKLKDKLKELRNYGQKKKYYSEGIGINSRLDEIQSAILRVKLKYLEKWNNDRRIIADKYLLGLRNLKTQKIVKGGKSNYYLFVVEIEKRNEMQNFLLNKGIDTLIHYPIPIHLQKVYKNLGYENGDFPNTENIANKILSIPMYPELKNEDQDHIINVINSYYE